MATVRPVRDALPSPTPRAARLAALLLVAGLMLGAWRAGLLGAFSDPARARAAVLGMGALGQVGFVLAYAALQPFGVPGTAFILAAALIWPWPAAFGLSMAGTMAASVVGFAFARFVARDWVAARIPARFRAYDEALARRGFATVFTLRLIFWMPPMLHAFFGVSRVPFWTHFWASALGYVPPLLATAYFGERALRLAREVPAGVWVGATAAMLVGGFWYARRRWRRAGAVTDAVE